MRWRGSVVSSPQIRRRKPVFRKRLRRSACVIQGKGGGTLGNRRRGDGRIEAVEGL